MNLRLSKFEWVCLHSLLISVLQGQGMTNPESNALRRIRNKLREGKEK